MMTESIYGHELSSLSEKENIYEKLNSLTFEDYYKDVVYSSLKDSGIEKKEIIKYSDLENRLDSLKKAKGLYFVLSENDFLLSSQQLQWLKDNFQGKYSLFENGGHLGNMWLPEVKAIIGKQLKQ